MKKKWTLLVLISVFVLALAACQQGGDKKTASQKSEQKKTEQKITDPKQLFTTAYKNTQDAKTFDVSADIDINVDPSSIKDENKEFVEVINNAKLKADVRGNTETKQYEVVLKSKFSYQGLSMDINLPVYIDENKQHCYVKVDSMIKSFGFVLNAKGINLESVKDKYLEVPIEYYQQQQITSQKTEEIKQKTLESLGKIDIPKDNFKKEELTDKEKQQGAAHKITLSFSDENFKALFINFVNVLGEAMNKPIKDNKMSQLKDGLKKINFKKMNFTATIDDKNAFQNFNTDILVNVGQFEKGNFSGDIGLKLSTTYNSVNGDITFKYKPKENQIVTQAELNKLLMQRKYN
ncbi:hypothetical protein PJ311_14690 [Bacillus sp. CLL-7-23]|uniref:Lipoprotein n=1 Tax=Bacillus changyiensis TaxID=3004103 RepID=A0ABT4X7W5_9BACI|nr:hypothetical protein [Bacillus changyiensis]MDA7027824.1 hypothetical protein [Bacillus changyiensis]